MSRYVKLAPQQRRMGKRDFSVTCTQEAKEIEETFEKALSFPSKTRSSWSATEFASLFKCSAFQTSADRTSLPHLLHTLDRDIIEVGQLSARRRISVKIRLSWSSSESFTPGTVVVTERAKSKYRTCCASAGLLVPPPGRE